MEDLVTFVLTLKVTQVSDGLLLEAFGKREDGSSGGYFTSAIEKVEAVAVKNGGKPVDKEQQIERHTFYKAFLFPNDESIKDFEEELISS